jgi:hypothetical protein
MCANCSSVVGKGTIVRDCRGIEMMGIMCKVGIVDYPVSVKYGGGRDSRGKGGGGEEGKQKKEREKRRREEKIGSEKRK